MACRYNHGGRSSSLWVLLSDQSHIFSDSFTASSRGRGGATSGAPPSRARVAGKVSSVLCTLYMFGPSNSPLLSSPPSSYLSSSSPPTFSPPTFSPPNFSTPTLHSHTPPLYLLTPHHPLLAHSYLM